MSKANCCISGSSWSYHFAERSIHCLRYITQGMIEKLYRVLVDAGDMAGLQRWLLYLWFGGTLGKQVPKQVPRSQDRTPSLSMSL